jgi:hypothetical protein
MMGDASGIKDERVYIHTFDVKVSETKVIAQRVALHSLQPPPLRSAPFYSKILISVHPWRKIMCSLTLLPLV